MSVQLQQDQSYIAEIRTKATTLLEVANTGRITQAEWNALFGGATRLGSETFLGEDEGLDKAAIEAANSALYALNAWLDTDSRRSALLAVMI